MPNPFVSGSYDLDSRPASVQRTVNMMPVPIEPGNEREGWVFKDVPGLVAVSQVIPPSTLVDCDLLIHFDEANALVWTDFSSHEWPLTITPASGSLAGVSDGVFGNEGAILNPHPGDNAEAYYNTHANIRVATPLNFGNADFYMSGYFTIPTLPPNDGSFTIIDNRNQDYDGGWLWQFHEANDGSTLRMEFSAQNDGGVSSSGSVVVPDHAGRHLYAVSRSGNTFYFFIDATLVGSAVGAIGSTQAIRDTTRNLSVFAANRNLTAPDQLISSFNGKAEELYVNHGPGTGITGTHSMPTIPFDSTHTLRQILGIDA